MFILDALFWDVDDFCLCFEPQWPKKLLAQGFFGQIFADRGYVSQKLSSQLLEEFGIQLFAKPGCNTKSRPKETSSVYPQFSF